MKINGSRLVGATRFGIFSAVGFFFVGFIYSYLRESYASFSSMLLMAAVFGLVLGAGAYVRASNTDGRNE